MSGKVYNYWAIALYAFIAVALVIVALHYLKVDPFQTVVDTAEAYIAKVNWISLFTNNWGIISASVLPVAGTLVSVYMYKLKASELQKQVEANTKLSSSNSNYITNISETSKALTDKNATIQTLEEKLAQYESGDSTVTELQTSFSRLQTENLSQKGQITQLQQMLEAEIQKRPVITQTVVK